MSSPKERRWRGSCGDEVMSDNPEETLRAYLRAFESLDPDAVVPFYHLPCMFITPVGVTLVSHADSARGVASTLIDHARSQDYRRTDCLALDVKLLGQRLASLSGTFARFDSKGEE